MVRLLLCSLVLSMMIGGCDKKDEVEDIGPVWILNVIVRDGEFPNREISSCAHVKWKYSGEFEDRDTPCRIDNNFVKVWEQIHEDVRIFFHVECPGYTSSEETYVDFAYALVDTNSDGQEVIQNRTINIYPE